MLVLDEADVLLGSEMAADMQLITQSVGATLRRPRTQPGQPSQQQRHMEPAGQASAEFTSVGGHSSELAGSSGSGVAAVPATAAGAAGGGAAAAAEPGAGIALRQTMVVSASLKQASLQRMEAWCPHPVRVAAKMSEGGAVSLNFEGSALPTGAEEVEAEGAEAGGGKVHATVPAGAPFTLASLHAAAPSSAPTAPQAVAPGAAVPVQAGGNTAADAAAAAAADAPATTGGGDGCAPYDHAAHLAQRVDMLPSHLAHFVLQCTPYTRLDALRSCMNALGSSRALVFMREALQLRSEILPGQRHVKVGVWEG